MPRRGQLRHTALLEDCGQTHHENSSVVPTQKYVRAYGVQKALLPAVIFILQS